MSGNEMFDFHEHHLQTAMDAVVMKGDLYAMSMTAWRHSGSLRLRRDIPHL
jgi:hypothetical protein